MSALLCMSDTSLIFLIQYGHYIDTHILRCILKTENYWCLVFISITQWYLHFRPSRVRVPEVVRKVLEEQRVVLEVDH